MVRRKKHCRSDAKSSTAQVTLAQTSAQATTPVQDTQDTDFTVVRRKKQRPGKAARDKMRTRREDALLPKDSTALPASYAIDFQTFPSLAISAASQTSKAHQRALKTTPPYTRTTAFKAYLARTVTPERRFINEFPTLEHFVVPKARALRPATSQHRSLPALAPLPFEDRDSATHLFLAHNARWSSRRSYASVVTS